MGILTFFVYSSLSLFQGFVLISFHFNFVNKFYINTTCKFLFKFSELYLVNFTMLLRTAPKKYALCKPKFWDKYCGDHHIYYVYFAHCRCSCIEIISSIAGITLITL